MKFLIVVVALFGLALAAPSKDSEAVILEGVNFANTDTGYKYDFKTSNDIKQKTDLTSGIVTGSYEYVDPDGRLIQVTYTAGAGIGFNPKSDIIAPEVMEAVERNLKNPAEEIDA